MELYVENKISVRSFSLLAVLKKKNRYVTIILSTGYQDIDPDAFRILNMDSKTSVLCLYGISKLHRRKQNFERLSQTTLIYMSFFFFLYKSVDQQ